MIRRLGRGALGRFFRNRAAGSRITQILLNFWLFSLTPSGKIFSFCVFMSGAIGSVSLDIPIFHLFNILASAWVVIGLAAFFLRPRLALQGQFPDHVTAGEAVTLHFRAENTGRRPASDVGLYGFAVPKEIDVREATAHGALDAHESADMSIALVPRQRGSYGPLGIRAYTAYPNHLFRIACSPLVEGTMLVYPHFHPLAGLRLEMGRRLQPGGIALTSSVGESMEYIGNREYRYGDPIRRIDFKAWARLSRPAVREYQEEYFSRVGLVIDTYIETQRNSWRKAAHENLEAAISLCAAIADVLSRGEYIIDVFAAGSELYVFRAGRHTMHFDHVLEVLSCVDACNENPFQRITPALADELGSISSLICVLLDWDEQRAGMVRLALESGCSVKVLLLRDSPPAMPFEEEGVDFQQLSVEDVQNGKVEYL